MTADSALPSAPDNAPAYSVSELAFALKRTLEDSYGYVRLRGELSKVTRHASGHCYLSLKDDKACIDGVVWKGSVRGLQVQPEQGLEVIVTGRITTYPASSKYQIVIETMEVAGVGALLAQLERLKAKLAAEGLFDASRKRPIPSMPAVIGVITSPTGAVIRDILHRIRDRWPCRVVVWPVVVQGDAAAAQVCAALSGFEALGQGGAIPRPDLIIVARGGGSVEDLWPFNDEALARAVSALSIPVISAVGHETDTTLIDFVSDRRAPTPTAAAEMATPVLGELRAAIADHHRRLARSGARMVEDRRSSLLAAGRGLPKPGDLLGMAGQRLDGVAGKLAFALGRNVALHERELVRAASQLRPSLLAARRDQYDVRLRDMDARLGRGLERQASEAQRRLDAAVAQLARDHLARHRQQFGVRLNDLNLRLNRALARAVFDSEKRLTNLDRLLSAANPDRPLDQGFARVMRDGKLVRNAAALAAGDAVALTFVDGTASATVDGEGAPAKAAPVRAAPKPKAKPAPAGQGDLF